VIGQNPFKATLDRHGEERRRRGHPLWTRRVELPKGAKVGEAEWKGLGVDCRVALLLAVTEGG
jgi:hypothetical protein